MLRDFLLFLRALWQRWVILVTGGSIVAIPALLTLFGLKPLPQNVNWLIVGLTFMLAAFFSWRSEWINAGQSFVEINFKTLKEICKGRTGPQAKQLLRHYFGKRVKTTGVLSSFNEGMILVIPANLFLSVNGGPSAENGGYLHVDLYPWNRSFRGITAFPLGTTLTVSGRITKINSSIAISVSLSSCELIKAEFPVSS